MAEEKMKVEELPVDEIYSDPEFNVRGDIAPGSVIDLARNIQTNTLLQPISVQPFDRVINDHRYKWRIVVGHRRHMAFQLLERERIPCVIKENLNDLDAFTLNYIENINREQLNILQEAKGLEKFKKAGLTIEETSKRINQSKGWIQIRFALLGLPEPIQNEAAAGYITQTQIRDLNSLGSAAAQLEAVKKLKDARISGEKRALSLKDPKKGNPTKAKKRGPTEIDEMIVHMLETVGPNIGTRALAWANGNIPDI